METSLEYISGNLLKDEMLAHIEAHPNKFEELIKLAITDSTPHSARAAWLLWNSIDKNDGRIKNHVPEIINVLTTVKDGHQRDLIRILSMMEINEEDEGRLFDICVDIWCKLSKIPSVRYTAFKLILQITKKHPELSGEVSLLTEDYYVEPLSSGIRRSIKKMIKNFK